MKLAPIIKSKMEQYKVKNELQDLGESDLFEHFVNQMILASHDPIAFDCASELMDRVCVGGCDDMGIDGIAIKVNGSLIADAEGIYSIIQRHTELEIEFIFIQSKFQDSFSYTGYLKFITGIENFLADPPIKPYNEKIAYWLNLKEIIFSAEVLNTLVKMPTIRACFSTLGVWRDDEHILGGNTRFKENLKKIHYNDPIINLVGEEELLAICNSNENVFSISLDFIDTLNLTDVPNVDNSIVVLLQADELLKLLENDDGLLRRSLFNDNVRDYLQTTNVNSEIRETLSKEPQNFVLLNNGITIVCDKLITNNRRISIRNPQVVNGCQTCHELFKHHDAGGTLNNVAIIAKVIATTDSEITNKVVQGANKQNIVYDEAFEVIKPFHKNLEQFFTAVSGKFTRPDSRILYERRVKQFAGQSNITIYQKVNFRALIQSFVSVFLYKPEVGFKHESKLLQEFENIVFNSLHSFYSYFYSAALFVRLEKYFKLRVEDGQFRSYKNHIAMLIPLIVTRATIPLLDNNRKVEEYCRKLFFLLDDFSKFETYVQEAIRVFELARQEWISTKGVTFKYGIKDSADYTKLLLSKSLVSSDRDLPRTQFIGTVINVGEDRRHHIYGFISRSPQKIYFAASDNPQVDCCSIAGKHVSYDVVRDPMTNRERAVNIKRIKP